jgi:catechol 2,3-dioxygenase-like lactoylglutathione lyase family enzyme
MSRLDHVALPVRDIRSSKAWYTEVLGLSIEMESDDPPFFCGLVDERDTTIFLSEVRDAAPLDGMAIWYAVDDVVAFHERHASSVDFVHGPQLTGWGFGVEVRDPTGHVIRVWDEVSMERGHG